jgi:hypothetical protein
MPRLDGRQMTMVLAPLRRQRSAEESGSKEPAEAAVEETSSETEPEEE